MRIVRFAAAGQDPTYGILELEVDGGEHPDSVATLTNDPLAGVAVNYTGERHLLEDVRLLAPVIPRSKVVGVGRNYADHAAEMGTEVPVGAPLLFFKPNTSVIGPGEAIVIPEGCEELHYEGELAVIIGRICKQVPSERVPEVIFGYTIANDVTARDLQRRDGQWTRAKGFDTFCPVGTAVPATGIDPTGLEVICRVNGEVRQHGRADEMAFPIPVLIEYITAIMTLEPGDIVATGTPSGVGPLQSGDVVEVEIPGVGRVTNPVA